METPGYRAVMHGAAARLVAVALRGDRRRTRFGVGTPGDGLAAHVRTEVLTLEVAQLVLRGEVPRRKPRAAFEPNDLETGFCELGCEDTACCADADDDDVCLFRCHGSGPPHGGPRLQADDFLAGVG